MTIQDHSGIGPDTFVIRSVDPVSTEIEGETVLLNLDTGKYHGLDDIGSRVWALLEEGRTVSDLCATLQGEYDVEPEQCERETLAFLARLLEASLVRVGDAPDPG